ncbi:putative homing endonuclease [Campylobacter phage F358]|uniref:Putative homing endonuclease n=3 Tax=Fletchervirus CPX TaxID=1110702 RepID=A0A7T3KF71_9CAUD|nr:putative homing endonuclease [Campylobacter phage F357]QPX64019.1 putative homing endonuclease [Campylobacter phage F358]QPX64182.1 putative homing endonuclease [Campylobacter phage F360]
MDKIKFINDLGYEVVSEDLIRNLEVKCKNGHIFKREFDSFKKGAVDCPECIISEKIKLIEDLGYKIISDNLSNDLQVQCKNGHIFKRSFNNFKKGAHACLYCDAEYKTKFITNLGYKIVSKHLGCNLIVQCKNGHSFKRPFSEFRDGNNKCNECEYNKKFNYISSLGYKIISLKDMHNIVLKCKNGHIIKKDYWNILKNNSYYCDECAKNDRIKFINDNGYEVISLKSDLVKCKNGHLLKRRYGDLKNGFVECPECIKEHKIRFITSLGYKILSDDLVVNLEVQCKNGHTFKRPYESFKKGISVCHFCVNEEKEKYLNDINFEIVSDTLGGELEVKCKNGHVFKRPYTNFKKGHILCPICNPLISSFEKELENLIEVDYTRNNRKVLDGKELDFYFPDYNLAIECNGDYWHSESNGKDKYYHSNKTDICNKKGIQLLHIFESSWIEKKDIWTSIINNKLGKSKKIMARKCILKKVDKAEEKEFLNTNHLQGFIGSNICYGLYFNDELVCLMSFGKPRFTNKYDWELIRLCTKMGMNVIGGASKLLKHFEKENKGSIISYSDRLYSDGSIYKQLGFTFSHYSKPGYYYFKGINKHSRQQFMKHKLKDKLEKFDPNLTESENMRLNGYHKVWDCGQGVWIKSNYL